MYRLSQFKILCGKNWQESCEHTNHCTCFLWEGVCQWQSVSSPESSAGYPIGRGRWPGRGTMPAAIVDNGKEEMKKKTKKKQRITRRIQSCWSSSFIQNHNQYMWLAQHKLGLRCKCSETEINTPPESKFIAEQNGTFILSIRLWTVKQVDLNRMRYL